LPGPLALRANSTGKAKALWIRQQELAAEEHDGNLLGHGCKSTAAAAAADIVGSL